MSELFAYIAFVAKILVVALVLVVLYTLNQLIIKPILFRRRFMKYANVYVDPNHRHVVGGKHNFHIFGIISNLL